MLSDKKWEELRSQKNIAVVIVSSDAQDVARQLSEFERIEQKESHIIINVSVH